MDKQFLISIVILEAVVLPLWICYREIIKKQRPSLHELYLLLLVISFTAAAAVTIIPVPLTMRAGQHFPPIHYIPFVRTATSIYEECTSPTYSSNIMVGNMRDNLLMFIPIGIFLKLAKPGFGYKKIFLLSFFSSVSFELLQYVSLYFGNVRYVDIDDVVHNSLGGLVGYYISILLIKIGLKPSSLSKNPHHPQRDK